MKLSEELMEFKQGCHELEIEMVRDFVDKAQDLEEELEQLQDELRMYSLKFRIIEDIAKEALDGIE